MLSLNALRSSFSAAYGAVLIVILMAGFVVTASTDCYDFVDEPIILHGDPTYAKETDLLVSIRRDGSILVGPEYAELVNLAGMIRESRAIDKTRHLVLHVDRAAKFLNVRDVVRAARAAGYERLYVGSDHQSIAYIWAGADSTVR